MATKNTQKGTKNSSSKGSSSMKSNSSSKNTGATKGSSRISQKEDLDEE